MTGTLITAIVPRGAGIKLCEEAKKAGAAGGTIITGRGTAHNDMMQMLGLGSAEKDIVLILEHSGHESSIIKAAADSAPSDKKHYGIIFTVELSSILKNRTFILSEGETGMKDMSSHELITVIVNDGSADDVMAAARKAGASGGTIITGHGTGKTDDVSFFGITLVPEKEILLIISEKTQTPAILQAVKDLECLSSPCSGISFCIPVCEVINLGKK